MAHRTMESWRWLHCQLVRKKNTVLPARQLVGAKKYYQVKHFCQMISYGHGTVAVADPAIETFVRQYLQGCRYPFSAFDEPNINCLDKEVKKHGQTLCFLAEYFLPQPSEQVLPVPDHLQIRLLYENELLQLYPDKRFPMALSLHPHRDQEGRHRRSRIFGFGDCRGSGRQRRL